MAAVACGMRLSFVLSKSASVHVIGWLVFIAADFFGFVGNANFCRACGEDKFCLCLEIALYVFKQVTFELIRN